MKLRLGIQIGQRAAGEGEPSFVIAEAGVNHNGQTDLALKLIAAAAEAGADAVKFQTFRAEQVVTARGELAPYQVTGRGDRAAGSGQSSVSNQSSGGDAPGQLALLKKLELPEAAYASLRKECEARGLLFLSTPHGGIASADFLRTQALAAYKIGSGDLTNHPLLRHVARFGAPMILGTGMSTLAEVREAVDVIRLAGNEQIIVLHCTSNYPCPDAEVNLRAMPAMRAALGVLTGYSDHTADLQTAIMAVTLGACVIEKHFTLDRSLPGPDHNASLLPGELAELVRGIRRAEKILGAADKKPCAGELPTLKVARKSLVAARPIQKGERFSAENLGVKRPGDGLAPRYYDVFLGKLATRALAADELLQEGDCA